MRFMVTEKQWREAERRGREWMQNNPHAVAAVYIPKIKRVLVTLNTGIEVAINPEKLQTLQNAKTSQLRDIEITPMGDALYFPKLSDGVYLPGVLKGVFGTAQWMRDQREEKLATKQAPKSSRRKVAQAA